MNNRKAFFILCMAFFFASHAQTVFLSGTVIDNSTGKPLSGAVVRLPSFNLSDTSSTNGAYLLTTPSTQGMPNVLFGAAHPILRTGADRIVVAIGWSCHASIRLFDVSGNLVALLHDGTVRPGQTFMFPKEKLGTSVMLLRIDSDAGIETCRLVSFHGKIIATGRILAADLRTPLAKKCSPDSLTAFKTGYVPFSKSISLYTGTINIALDPATRDNLLAQSASHKGIALAQIAAATGALYDMDTLCGRIYQGDSGSYAVIRCENFGFYELVTSWGFSGYSRYACFLLLAKRKPDQLRYGLTCMTGIPGMCFQDSSKLDDTLALSGGYTAKNCTSSNKPSFYTPVVYFPTYNYFPFVTAVFNARMDSIAAPLDSAALEPPRQGVATFTMPLKDTVIKINGSCLLLSTLSNVTISATQTMMIGSQADARFCRLLAHDFSFAGGRFENSMLYSGTQLTIETGTYLNTQLICEDSLKCLPGADFTNPNVWISRAHLTGHSIGGIFFKDPAKYSGTALSIKRQSDRDSYTAGIAMEKFGSFAGYVVTDSKFYIQQVDLKGKFWIYTVQTDIDYMTYIEFLFGVKLFYLAEVLPFPDVGQSTGGYIIVNK